MKPHVLTLAAAICSLILSPVGRLAAATTDPSGEYRIVEGSRPDGTGRYRGKVSVEKAGSAAFTVNWALESGEAYHGPALFMNGVLGAGFGEGLTGLAVYEIKGRILKAKWLLSATPQTVGDYELSGSGTLNGFYKFTNGVAGGVTFKPNGKIYDVVFSLPTGNVPGIAVRVGDVLIAASGTPGGKGYGLAAYHAAGNKVEGVWAVSGQNGLGTENLGPGGADQAPAETASAATAPGGAVGFNAAGTEVRFAGDAYQLKDSQSAPGRPTSELREYLRAGETFDQYPKMFALRVQEGSGADPLTFTRAVLATVKKDTPSADTSEIAHDENSATMEFLLVNGNDAEYNFWHYFRMPQGRLASVQFVLRNKPPYETKDKFKAERKAHFEDWVRDARTLATQVPGALAKTTKVSAAGGQTAEAPPKPAEKKPEMTDDALAEKLSADVRTAAGIAGNFLVLLQDGKLPEAAALVSDEGLAQNKTTRRDFLARLLKDQAADGRMVSFIPDKKKLKFGAEAGGVYFVLVADSKCEKTPAATETLRFFRFPDGQVRMVNYQRSGGAAGR